MREMSADTAQNFDCNSVTDSSLRSVEEIKMLVMGFLLRLPDRDHRGLHDAAVARAFGMTAPLGPRKPFRACSQPNLCEDAKLKAAGVVDRLEGKQREEHDDCRHVIERDVNVTAIALEVLRQVSASVASVCQDWEVL